MMNISNSFCGRAIEFMYGVQALAGVVRVQDHIPRCIFGIVDRTEYLLLNYQALVFSFARLSNLVSRVLHFSRPKCHLFWLQISDMLPTGQLVNNAKGSMMLRLWMSLCAVGSS